VQQELHLGLTTNGGEVGNAETKRILVCALSYRILSQIWFGFTNDRDTLRNFKKVGRGFIERPGHFSHWMPVSEGIMERTNTKTVRF